MLLISGPCIIESKDQLRQTVESLLESTHTAVNIDFYFKSSIIKDNRTLHENFNTIGLQKAVEWMTDIKKEYKVKICTDFHNEKQIEDFSGKFDVIQIPAFLARQNSLQTAAATAAVMHGNKVFVKKPQFISPSEVWKIRENLKYYGPMKEENIIIADRGTQLGYDQVFMDPRHIEIMKQGTMGLTTSKTVADISHPQKGYIKSVPSHVLAWRLGLAYIAAGADGLFFETHPCPNDAMCDKDTQIPLGYDRKIIKDCYELWRSIRDYNE